MTIHAPVPDYAAARRAMVENQLRPQGVTDAAVLDAMGGIERELFLPSELRPLAYSDRAILLGAGRFLPPCPVTGQLLTQMAPAPGERALVISAGTGYSAAVLCTMGLKVTALGSADLVQAPTTDGVTVVEGQLEQGHAAGAPYDIVLLDGAVEQIPDAIIAQLADGGRLGGALVDRGVTRLIVGRKAGGGFGSLSISDAGVPPLPGFQRHRTFTF